MPNIEGLRHASEAKRNALLANHGIVMEQTGARTIKVDLEHDVIATIRAGDPFDRLSIASEVRHVHIQNGGTPVIVVDAEHRNEGEHDFYLLGKKSFRKITEVKGRADLALELAIALRSAVTEDPRTKRLLSFFDHSHISQQVVDHIVGAKPQAKAH